MSSDAPKNRLQKCRLHLLETKCIRHTLNQMVKATGNNSKEAKSFPTHEHLPEIKFCGMNIEPFVDSSTDRVHHNTADTATRSKANSPAKPAQQRHTSDECADAESVVGPPAGEAAAPADTPSLAGVPGPSANAQLTDPSSTQGSTAVSASGQPPPPSPAPRLSITPRRRPTRDPADRSAPSRPVVVTPALIDSLRGRPLPHAARAAGLSVTAFKSACRRLGVRRWDYTRGPARPGPPAGQPEQPPPPHDPRALWRPLRPAQPGDSDDEPRAQGQVPAPVRPSPSPAEPRELPTRGGGEWGHGRGPSGGAGRPGAPRSSPDRMDPMDSDPGPAGGPAPVPAAASAAQPAAASRPSPAAPQCVPSFPGHGCGPAAAAGEGPAVPDPDDEGDSEQPPRG